MSYRKEKGVKHRHMPHASSHVFNPQDGIEEKSYVHEEYVKSVKEEENQVRHTTAWTRPFSLLALCFLTPMLRRPAVGVPAGGDRRAAGPREARAGELRDVQWREGAAGPGVARALHRPQAAGRYGGPSLFLAASRPRLACLALSCWD